jgi:hypothetical protein
VALITTYPPALVFYRGIAPCIIRVDTTFFGMESNYLLNGPFALWLTMLQEKCAFRKGAVVITLSVWSKKVLQGAYKAPDGHIGVYPQFSNLPLQVIPKEIDIPNW